MDVRADLRAALEDRYRFERELGSGASAVVYLARDLRHERDVAIKVLRPDLISGFSADRFLREIRISASLQHPHILALYDSGQAAGHIYCVMPYVKGETLRALLRRERQLPIDEALRLTRQVADALSHAHKHGIVHRDIKPENILLAGGDAFVADFGIAHSVGAEVGERLTQTGTSIGTPHYMSPEQATGERELDGRSDIYSLACVTYEMLAGEPPFDGPNMHAVISRHLQQPAPSIRVIRKSVPAHIDDAIQVALSKAPVDRFRDAASFASALEDPDYRPTLTTLSGRATRASRRAAFLGRWKLAFPVAAALVLVALGARETWSRLTTPDLDPDLLAIAPFDAADAPLAPWRQGLLDLLAQNLNGAGPLKVVPPSRVVDGWDGRADEYSAVALGRRTAAHAGIVGSIYPRGADSVRLTAAVYEVGSRRLLGDVRAVVPLARMDQGADSLTVGILQVLGRERALGTHRPPSAGTSAMAALKAYLQAEVHYRRMDWDAAQPLYERAVQLDTNFALAYHRLSFVRSQRTSGIDSLIWFNGLRAGRLHRGLPERDSLVVMIDSLQAAVWYYTTESTPVSDSLDDLFTRRLFATHDIATRRYPEDAELWYMLAVNLDQLAGPMPDKGRRTLAALDRTIALDSAFLPAYTRAINLAAALHGEDAARRYIAAFIARRPEGQRADAARIADILFDPRRAGTEEAERALRSAGTRVLLSAWGPLLWWYDSSETAVRVARRLLAHPDATQLDPRGISYAEFILAMSLATRGHMREACATMPDPQWNLFPQAALLGCTAPDSASAVVRMLERRYEGQPRRLVIYLPWWSAMGDTTRLAEMRRVGDAVTRTGADGAARAQGRVLAASARGYLALARRDSTEALTRFLDAQDTLCQFCDAQRLAKARLLAAAGRAREAITVLEFDLERNIFPLAFALRLQRARLAEQLGDTATAADDYSRVWRAWVRGDPAMRDSAELARAALERLRRRP